jgi:hypothetical protein
MKLSVENVERIFRDSLFREEEVKDIRQDSVSNMRVTPPIPKDAVVVQGIRLTFGFHKKRLESHREELRDMLSQLPEEFITGGGWSFLNLCMTKAGEHWAEHPAMEKLLVLSMGLELMAYCLPDRELWQIFPGGMPYVVVLL